jgi:hypothetical protein
VIRATALLGALLLFGCREQPTNQPQNPDPRAATRTELIRAGVEEALGTGNAVQSMVSSGGAMSAQLPGATTVVLARKNADGSIDRSCVESADAAAAFVDGASALETH